MFNHFFNRAVYGTMWINIIESNQPQITVWYTRIACWTLRATNTHLEYAFPLQQWLHVNASILRYTYVACLIHV
jgi:hypothetical protein